MKCRVCSDLYNLFFCCRAAAATHAARRAKWRSELAFVDTMPCRSAQLGAAPPSHRRRRPLTRCAAAVAAADPARMVETLKEADGPARRLLRWSPRQPRAGISLRAHARRCQQKKTGKGASSKGASSVSSGVRLEGVTKARHAAGARHRGGSRAAAHAPGVQGRGAAEGRVLGREEGGARRPGASCDAPCPPHLRS